MSAGSHAPTPPARYDLVEVIDQRTGYRVTAVVEDVGEGQCVLLFDRGADVPQEASLHWDDGDAGWRAPARLERLEETTAHMGIAPASEWERAPTRRSLRIPVDHAPMLVRILESSAPSKQRRVHAVCVDVSDSGCRANWPGRSPLVGEAVELAWDTGSWHHDVQPEWIPARVARVISLPFGLKQVGFKFEITDHTQAARIQTWALAWMREHRKRALARRSA